MFSVAVSTALARKVGLGVLPPRQLAGLLFSLDRRGRVARLSGSGEKRQCSRSHKASTLILAGSKSFAGHVRFILAQIERAVSQTALKYEGLFLA